MLVWRSVEVPENGYGNACQRIATGVSSGKDRIESAGEDWIESAEKSSTFTGVHPVRPADCPEKRKEEQN